MDKSESYFNHKLYFTILNMKVNGRKSDSNFLYVHMKNMLANKHYRGDPINKILHVIFIEIILKLQFILHAN